MSGEQNWEPCVVTEEIEDSHYRTGLRAQIAVLEEEDVAMGAMYGGTNYTNDNIEWRQAKIAALRKELGE